MDEKDIERARDFAAKAHAHQRRKSTRIPYIEHPLAVARMLEEVGATAETVIAGLLHDTTEDCGVTLDEIRKEFGESVASIVAGASEPDRSLPWEKRKAHTIQALRTVPLEPALVSAADKIDNLRSIARDLGAMGHEIWDRFNRGREKQEWYYRGILESLRENASGIASHPLVRILEDEISRVFGPRPC